VFKNFDGRFCHTIEKGVTKAGGHKLDCSTGRAGGTLCHKNADWI
jgi:hypothetical protein